MLKWKQPQLDELHYRQKWLSNEKTMAYNQKYGGTIPFPQQRWNDWYEKWIKNPDQRFYAYLYSEEEKDYVGEISYHYEEKYDEIIASIIIDDAFRHLGYGKEGLSLLCEKAKEDGYDSIADDISIDNSSMNMFYKQGFVEIYRNDEIVYLRKKL